MKKLLIVLLLFSVTFPVWAVDTEVHDMAEETAEDGSDVLYLVGDPGGTPVSRKITIDNLFDAIDTSLELLTYLTDESGTGAALFGTDPEITNDITFVGTVPRKRIYISATGGLVPTTTGAADAVQTELGSTDINRINVMTVDFDNAADKYWIAHFTLPENYDGGTFTSAISWTCTASASLGVAWFVQLLGMSSGDVMGATNFGTAIEINDDGEVTDDYLLTAESAAITENHAGGSGTTVGGDELWIKVYRDVSDGDDDLTTDGKFIGIWLTFGIDQLSTED